MLSLVLGLITLQALQPKIIGKVEWPAGLFGNGHDAPVVVRRNNDGSLGWVDVDGLSHPQSVSWSKSDKRIIGMDEDGEVMLSNPRIIVQADHPNLLVNGYAGSGDLKILGRWSLLRDQYHFLVSQHSGVTRFFRGEYYFAEVTVNPDTGHVIILAMDEKRGLCAFVSNLWKESWSDEEINENFHPIKWAADASTELSLSSDLFYSAECVDSNAIVFFCRSRMLIHSLPYTDGGSSASPKITSSYNYACILDTKSFKCVPFLRISPVTSSAKDIIPVYDNIAVSDKSIYFLIGNEILMIDKQYVLKLIH